MVEYKLLPLDFSQKLSDIPSGHFMLGRQLCFKTDYKVDGKIEAYNSSGEYLCALIEEDGLVTPCEMVVIDE